MASLSAKPIIDIDPVISDVSALPSVIPRLEAVGYLHEGDLGIPRREAFRHLDKPHLRTHHLYVCPQDSREPLHHLAFRNYLRQHPEAARKYSLVKETAAGLFPNDIDKYMAYKAPCIEESYALCGLT